MKIIELGGNVRKGVRIGRGNAGDTALGSAFQNLYQRIFPDPEIHYMECRKIFNHEDIKQINNFDVLFLAGGGLFLYDNFKNDVSDWEWGINSELIEKIKIPIVVYSIGYNKFRGHPEFREIFDNSVSKLIEKSIFFSMRNSGSIRSVRKHVNVSLRDKIKMNFCPTLVENNKFINIKNKNKKTVAFVLSGDRSKNRHADLYKFALEIKFFVEYLKNEGYKTILINHLYDYWISKFVKFDHFIELYNKPSEYIYQTYSNIDTVISDRGHGQMIPFSCGCKILSPISHDKLAWFLEDIGLEQFGVEANDIDLTSKLISKFKKLHELNWNEIYKEKMNHIINTNEKNLEIIKENF